jgi:HK97 family phage major capsid protein
MPRTLAEIKAEQTQLRTRVGTLVDEARAIEIKLEVDGANDGLEERKANVERGKAKASTRLAELGDEARAELRRRIDEGSVSTESEQDAIERSRPASETRVQSDMDPHRRAAFDVGMRTLERCQASGVMFHTAAERMEAALRHSDPSGTTGRYIAAVGADAYNSAFGKLLQYGNTASMRMTSEEMAAMQRVSQVESERVMSDGTTTAGGFAIPIGIDPTINLTSSGALCPVRQVADVRQITTHELRLVSADTPASTYAAELTEVGDGSPTLAQPVATTQKGQSFIPFSIEIGQDWSGLQEQLLKLLADGRDILDNTKFLSGTGTAEPVGLFASSGGLTTSQRIQTALTGTFGISDSYGLREGLAGSRFFANANFMAHPTTFDAMYRMVGGGNTTEPLPMPQGRGGPYVGSPKLEWNAMATGTTTGTKIVILGDWSGYVIADRIGAQVELVSHLFGSASRYPIGARGLYFYWRTGTCVLKPNAFRYLEMK